MRIGPSNVRIGEFFQKFTNKIPLNGIGKWPCFRGVKRNNRSESTTKISNNWCKKKPKPKWFITLLGEGHAAPAVLNGKVYLLDYDEKLKTDTLRCFKLKDGKELWRRWYKIKIKRNHGISRTIPAVTDKFVVTIGPKCQTMCVDACSGDFKWGIDMVRDLGAETPFWYTGQCPLIDKNVAILAPCGKKILMMGVDCETGKTVWTTPNDLKWKMSHSSIITAVVNGKKTYVYAALGGIIGVSAEKKDCGKILWKTTNWSVSVVAPSPVYLGDGKFLITSGYGAGGMLFYLDSKNKINIIKKYPPQKGICSEQQTPVAVGNKIYSILPKDAGRLRKRFACFSNDNCEKPIWTSDEKFGLGPYVFVDGKFLILDDDGTLSIINCNETPPVSLGKFQAIPNGHDAWGPIAVAGSKLLIRDLTRLYCYDLSE
jgi:outer membrane protein assembly factor BamB